MTTSLSASSIATDADLVAELASKDRLERAVRSEAQRDVFRASALQDVVDALRTRSPPVYESDLSAPAELKRAVVYRTLAKCFMSAIAAEGDVHHVLAKNYEREYQGAVSARFSVSPSQLSSPSGGSFLWERR